MAYIENHHHGIEARKRQIQMFRAELANIEPYIGRCYDPRCSCQTEPLVTPAVPEVFTIGSAEATSCGVSVECTRCKWYEDFYEEAQPLTDLLKHIAEHRCPA